jgi:hypothetical protein
MSKHGDKLAVHRRDCVRLSPLRLVTASSVPLGCVFGTMAVWTAHLAGAGIALTAIAGHVGLHRQTPLLLAQEALYRAQAALPAQLLAREPVRPPRE